MAELGLNQAIVADEAQISRSALNEVLNKDRMPGCDILVRIADRLDVSMDYLMNRRNYEIEAGLEDATLARLFNDFAALSHDEKEYVLTIIDGLGKKNL